LFDIIGLKNDKHIFNNIKRIDPFSNAYIGYRIMLTIHVLVVLTVKSFSKFKIIKA